MNNKIKKVLESKDIDFEYMGMGTMSEYDTQAMRYYVLTINNNCFEYFEGVGHDILTAENKENKILSAISCLVRDYFIKDYCDNVDDFMSEFGYTDYDHAQCVYKQLQENNSRLDRVFTAEELRVLEEETADF